MSKRTLKEEILRLANDRLTDAESRKDEFSKLAGGRMDRNFLSKERIRAIKSHEKARKMFTDLSSQLGDLQSRVQQAETDMNSAKDSMIDLNKIIQVMDLIGATDAKREKDGDCSYIVDGQRMYADTSDFVNIKLVPWKDKDSNKDTSEDDENDSHDLVEETHAAAEEYDDPLSFIPNDEEEDEKYASVESSLITKVAKKFR